LRVPAAVHCTPVAIGDKIPGMDDVPVVPSVDNDELGCGTTIRGLAPALPISTEPNGIPVRVAPEGDGDDMAEDDDAVPLVPQIAAVPALLEKVVPTSVPVPMVEPVPAGAPTPVLNSLVPTPNPPPSKVLLVPEPSVAARAIAEQVLPKPGKVIVPVAAGASPGDTSSVAPMGIPVGATGEPGVMPNGEVALMPGVGIPAPPTCANTGVQPNSADNIVENNTRRIMISIVPGAPIRPAKPVGRFTMGDPIATGSLDPTTFVSGLLRQLQY
jgi:hypothetical protein